MDLQGPLNPLAIGKHQPSLAKNNAKIVAINDNLMILQALTCNLSVVIQYCQCDQDQEL